MKHLNILNPEKEAKGILRDLLLEHDRFSISMMTEDESIETVECYSYEKSEIKKIASELLNLAKSIH